MSPRAVVVDDHRLLAQSIAISLRQEGVECVVADLADPETLVASILAERPDVVLLDLDLGAVTGDGAAQVAPLLRAGARVVLVTASTDPLRLAAAMEAGATGVLAKTDPIEVLVAAACAASRGERAMSSAQEQLILRAARRSPFARLTERESQVLRSLGDGHSVAVIASRARVGEATVRSQVRGVLTKLGVGSQLEAVALARRSGWL